MTPGSVSRPVVWQQFEGSRDADQITDDMREKAAAIKCSAEIMSVYPADDEERKKARNAARQVLSLCDQLERITRFFP
jgi:hypothetical protein